MRNGSGTYSLPAGNPVVAGTTITDTWANTTLSDMASALTGSIAADGQTPITANLPMSNFKLTGLAAGNATGNSLRWEQLFSQGTPTPVASAATVDIGSYNTNAVEISGVVAITSLGTTYNGPRFLKFTGALVLTYDATALITPTGASITTAAGDTCIAYPTSAGTGWTIFAYQRASGASLKPTTANTAFSAKDAASTTVDAEAATYATEVVDLGSNFNPTTGRYTAPVAGTYLFNFTIQGNTAAGKGCTGYLKVNGAGTLYGTTAVASPSLTYSLTTNPYSTGSFILTLAAGDYVSAFVTVSGAASCNVSAFSGYLIQPS